MGRFANIFPQRLTEIDPLTRRDHTYLEIDDTCYYFGEYTSGTGFAYSDTNNLISNLKKSVDRAGTDEWQYKVSAVQMVASTIRQALLPQDLEQITFVPIPPSKCKGDPLYDNRMIWILESVRSNPGLDIRELITQSQSTQAAHATSDRLTPDELRQIYNIDTSLVAPPPHSIALVDDLLTTGAHFRAAKSQLRVHFPGTSVIGIFVARRAIGPSPLD